MYLYDLFDARIILQENVLSLFVRNLFIPSVGFCCGFLEKKKQTIILCDKHPTTRVDLRHAPSRLLRVDAGLGAAAGRVLFLSVKIVRRRSMVSRID